MLYANGCHVKRRLIKWFYDFYLPLSMLSLPLFLSFSLWSAKSAIDWFCPLAYIDLHNENFTINLVFKISRYMCVCVCVLFKIGFRSRSTLCFVAFSSFDFFFCWPKSKTVRWSWSSPTDTVTATATETATASWTWVALLSLYVTPKDKTKT